MTNRPRLRKLNKFLLWFILLSTFGVGGGILFLLFGVVPIEQSYTDRGWSQYRIDNVMKYYVLGWVVFGFIVSFVYYRFVVRKERWKTAIVLMLSSIALCGFSLHFFLNTGAGLVQQSQGEVVEGERFTFGPYPEKGDMERIKAQGYDGIITLLSPTLPIEKPLLDKERKNAEAVGMDVFSYPMLPWVGDNTDSIEQIRELVANSDKKYYVHCYLGRHRVDIVKQVINEEGGLDYDVMFLQPTTFERGNTYYLPEDQLLLGPYPTDEEWFTRIKRAEVEEVITLLPNDKTKWIDGAQQVAQEMNMTFTHMPLNSDFTKGDLLEIVNYVKQQDHKIFLHRFASKDEILALEALLSWGEAIMHPRDLTINDKPLENVGAKVLIGSEPSEQVEKRLKEAGVNTFRMIGRNASKKTIYQTLLNVKQQKQTAYIYVEVQSAIPRIKQMLYGLLYGNDGKNPAFDGLALTRGSVYNHERNLIVGPVLSKAEYESLAMEHGFAQIIYLHSASVTDTSQLQAIKEQAEHAHIPLHVIDMSEGYESELIDQIEQENGLNYVMTDDELVEYINEFINGY
ncbi:hypothetical protein [Lentibacillus saliphilus]|uniref:hypothetical protein n=1 Tax=Lentibacillus saliphilus TaxID=2737028 RepID=UPI001C2F24E0|nr:hypothetical protein [Lentibacillus saliphilus]